MPRRNEAAEDAEDLRNAMQVIGQIISDGKATPKGKLQQIAGILFMFGVNAQLAAVATKEAV